MVSLCCSQQQHPIVRSLRLCGMWQWGAAGRFLLGMAEEISLGCWEGKGVSVPTPPPSSAGEQETGCFFSLHNCLSWAWLSLGMAARWRWQTQEKLLLCGMLLKLASGKKRARGKVLHHHTHVLLPLQLHQSFFRWGLASPFPPPPHFPWLALRPTAPAADAISQNAAAHGSVTSSFCCQLDLSWRKGSSASEVL